jgi:ornithine--oxo-acid transaminase
MPTARGVCELLLEQSLLVVPAHHDTVRIAPPLVVGTTELDFAVDRLAAGLAVAAEGGRR